MPSLVMYRKAPSVLRANVEMGVKIDGITIGSSALQILQQLHAECVIIFV